MALLGMRLQKVLQHGWCIGLAFVPNGVAAAATLAAAATVAVVLQPGGNASVFAVDLPDLPTAWPSDDVLQILLQHKGRLARAIVAHQSVTRHSQPIWVYWWHGIPAETPTGLVLPTGAVLPAGAPATQGC